MSQIKEVCFQEIVDIEFTFKIYIHLCITIEKSFHLQIGICVSQRRPANGTLANSQFWVSHKVNASQMILTTDAFAMETVHSHYWNCGNNCFQWWICATHAHFADESSVKGEFLSSLRETCAQNPWILMRANLCPSVSRIEMQRIQIKHLISIQRLRHVSVRL